jgi:hypothetical protein
MGTPARTIPYFEVQYQADSRLYRKPWKATVNAQRHKTAKAAEEVARQRSKKFAGQTYRVALVIGENETMVSAWYAGACESRAEGVK